VARLGGAAVSVRVAYIGGLGRSGSTLMELCVGSLEGTCSLGEVVHLWERGLRDDQRCGCGEAFSRCPFWAQVGEVAFGGWDRVDAAEVLRLKHAVDRNRFVPRLLAPRLATRHRRQVLAYTGYYTAVYRAALEVSGADVVVDSSKHVSLASCLRHDDQLDLRLVHAVRDSRGTTYSWSKQVVRPEITDRVEYMPRYPARTAASLWLAHNTMLEALAATGVARTLVRYEDFVADPAATLSRVGAHVGTTDGSVVHGDTVTLGTQHTVAGNPMRFTTGPVRLRLDEAWRRELPARDRRLATALTAPLLLRYGYPLGSG
jgi:hypothetical protein